jgi:predicted GNAT family N-acyltransferase
MSSGDNQFLSFLPPQGSRLANYDRSLSPSEQPPGIPNIFIDAMYVREHVFVAEQGVPFDREFDADDPTCWTWVAYASVSRRSSNSGNAGLVSLANSTPGPNQGHGPSEMPTEGRRESETSTATRVPAGTIRLLPPVDPTRPPQTPTAQTAPHPTEYKEPYILLGRLAVNADYRRLGLGRLLVGAALTWAKNSARAVFTSGLTPAEIEIRRIAGEHEVTRGEWKGLVVVHAQSGEAERFWSRAGFVKDEGMGEWFEEGIFHVGMLRKLELGNPLRHVPLH